MIAELTKLVSGRLIRVHFANSYNICRSMASGITPQEVEALCQKPSSATKDFMFQQTMYRIKDPKKSLPFYTGVLGMSLLQQLHFPEMKFSLFFMGYEDTSNAPAEENERKKWAMTRKATLELTYKVCSVDTATLLGLHLDTHLSWKDHIKKVQLKMSSFTYALRELRRAAGLEPALTAYYAYAYSWLSNWGTESDDSSYHNGNSDPRGFGHIGIWVPNVDDACARFEAQGVKFIKKPNDGKMKGLAFIQDPDGYWIEIFTTGVV